MRTPTSVFGPYLAPEETLMEASEGAITEGETRTEGLIGLTDRRLLFVGGDGEFTEVDYGYVCSIRSRRRRPFTREGLRMRLLAVLGGTFALAAFIGTLALAWSGIGAILAVSAVGGAVVAEAIRRTGIEIDWDAVSERIPWSDRSAAVDLASGRHRSHAGDREGGIVRQHWETEYVYAHQFILLTAAVVAALGIVGLVVHTGGGLVAFFALATLGAIAVTEFAVKKMRQLAVVGASRRDEREVRLELVSGRDVSVRFDETGRIDRVLSRSAGSGAANRIREPAGMEPTRP